MMMKIMIWDAEYVDVDDGNDGNDDNDDLWLIPCKEPNGIRGQGMAGSVQPVKVH